MGFRASGVGLGKFRDAGFRVQGVRVQGSWVWGLVLAEARKLEHHWPHALTVEYRESQHESS